MYPWSGDSAFDQVMKIIDPYSDVKPSISQYELARDRLILWQVKSPTFDHLPEIEATLSLISAVLKDRNIFGEEGEEGEVTGRLTHKYYDICTFYGMSIVKFCNLLPYYEMTKKNQINRIIKKSKKTVRDLGLALNLPSWVLECRHATCHASTNSLILLRQANTFCLTWIYSNYWSKIVEEEVGKHEMGDFVKFEKQVLIWVNSKGNALKAKSSPLEKKITNLIMEKPEQTFPIIIDILLRVTSKKLTNADMDLGELSSRIINSYSKIVRLIPNIDFLELFIHHLTKHFVDVDPRKARGSVLWFKVITRCLANQADENIMEALSLPELDTEVSMILWQRLLYKVVMRLNKHTSEVVEHLSNLIPTEFVPEKVINLLKQLAILATTVHNEKNTNPDKVDKSRESEKTDFFTIEDLVQIKSLESMDTS